MDLYLGHIAHRRLTGVHPRVGQLCFLYQKMGHRVVSFLCHLADSTPLRRVGYRKFVVVPEDVLGRLRAVSNHAGQVHRETFLEVDVRSAKYLGVWLCSWKIF